MSTASKPTRTPIIGPHSDGIHPLRNAFVQSHSADMSGLRRTISPSELADQIISVQPIDPKLAGDLDRALRLQVLKRRELRPDSEQFMMCYPASFVDEHGAEQEADSSRNG